MVTSLCHRTPGSSAWLTQKLASIPHSTWGEYKEKTNLSYFYCFNTKWPVRKSLVLIQVKWIAYPLQRVFLLHRMLRYFTLHHRIVSLFPRWNTHCSFVRVFVCCTADHVQIWELPFQKFWSSYQEEKYEGREVWWLCLTVKVKKKTWCCFFNEKRLFVLVVNT